MPQRPQVTPQPNNRRPRQRRRVWDARRRQWIWQ